MRKSLFPVVLLLLAMMPIVAQGQITTLVCGSRNATIVGTPGDDTIVVPSDVPSVVHARGGNDVVYGGDEQDLICGGRGADIIYAGNGSDESLIGGRGNDQLYGGPGEYDAVMGGPGADLLDGGPDWGDELTFADSAHGVHVNLVTGRAYGEGIDTLVANSFEDLRGSEYDDTLISFTHPFVMLSVVGRGGNDYIKVMSGHLYVEAGTGNDTIQFKHGARTDCGIGTGPGEDVVIGSAADDDFECVYGPGAEMVLGKGGDDEISVLDGVGDDTVNAGGGTDSCAYDPGDVVSSCESLNLGKAGLR
jgi:Ca2+-binding RTX toxin-like protein